MSRLRESARGQMCTVRLPGYCNHNPETVVLAHLNGAGMGMKHPDLFGAFACSDCHDVLDGRTKHLLHDHIVKLCHLQGMVRTQEYWLEHGLIKIGRRCSD